MTTQKKKSAGVNYSSTSRTYLTVADFKLWQRVSEATRAELEENVRREAVDSLVRYVTREMSKGMALQQAGDAFLFISKELRLPYSHSDAARAALIEMGWQQQ